MDDLEGYLFESPILLEKDNNDQWQEKKRYEQNKVKTNEKNKLYLGTIHSSKGLQFKAVILMKADNSTLNGSKGDENQLQINDERRLIYVAMSRAMKYLYITYPMISKKDGGLSLDLSDLIKPLLKHSELVIRKETDVNVDSTRTSPIKNNSSMKQNHIEMNPIYENKEISRNILSNDFDSNQQHQSTFIHHTNPKKTTHPSPYKSILHQSSSTTQSSQSNSRILSSPPSSHDIYGENNTQISPSNNYSNTQTSSLFNNLNYTQTTSNCNNTQFSSSNTLNYDQNSSLKYDFNNNNTQNKSTKYNNNQFSSSNNNNQKNNNINNISSNINHSDNVNSYVSNSKKRLFESCNIDDLDATCDASMFDSFF
jgi:hypothetical protein